MDLSPEWLRLPNKVELSKIMEVYAMIGLCGCIGSFDVVHVAWAACPFGWRHYFIGE